MNGTRIARDALLEADREAAIREALLVMLQVRE